MHKYKNPPRTVSKTSDELLRLGGIKMTIRLEDMKIKIILLWVVVQINMIFADIFSSMFPTEFQVTQEMHVGIRNNRRDSDCYDFSVLGH